MKQSNQENLIQETSEIQTIFDVAPTGMLLIDSCRRIIKTNIAFSKLIGKSKDEFLGEKLGNGINCFSSKVAGGCGSSNDCFECKIRRAIEDTLKTEREIKNIELSKTLMIDGKRKRFFFSLNTSLIKFNNTQHIILAISDITETKQEYLKKIKETNALLLSLLDSIPDIIVFKDLEGRYLVSNKGFTDLVGLSSDQVIGKTDHDFFEKQTADIFRKNDLDMLENNCSKHYRESITDPNGTIVPFDTIKTPLKNADGKTIGILGIARDITDIKEKEKSLHEAITKAEKMADIAETANNAKGQFLANMSHELRTPLNSIIGFGDMLSDTKLNAHQKDFVDIISNQSSLLLQLVNDILDFSKIDAGKLKLEIRKSNLKEIIANLRTIFSTSASRKGIGFQITYSKDLPDIIITDPGRLYQCFNNLINNAIKFTDKGKVSLDIYTEEINKQEYIRFDISDTGIGIPKDKQEYIFDYFTQIDYSHTRRYGGSGLGLAITKNIIDMLNGRLNLESEEGKGSTFSMSIPLKTVDNKNSEPQTKRQRQKKYEKFKGSVLVVEDSLMNQKVVKLMLEKLGLDVYVANDGAIAIKMVKAKEFDMIFMDIQMPNMNGYDSTVRMRELGIKTPIIALTANVMKDDKDKCLEAGCNDYIPKPLEIQMLVDVLKKHLKK
ncbi:MAG: ATP-binding protein [Sedimentisphaeraceae bacterium JB056]